MPSLQIAPYNTATCNLQVRRPSPGQTQRRKWAWPSAMKVTVLLLVLWIGCARGRPLNRDEELRGRSYGPDNITDICDFCTSTVKLLQDLLDLNWTLEQIFPVAEKSCVFVMQEYFHYNGPYLCPGFIHSYGPVIQYVFSHIVLQPQEVCDYLRYCNGSSKSAHNERKTLVLGRLSKMVDKVRRNMENLERPQLKHSLFNRESSLKEILSYKEQLVNSPMKSTERSNARKMQPSANGTITFLHLSDIHLDTMYKEGSPSQCGLYVCCRDWYNGTSPAGRYGAYNCDLPMATLELLVKTISNLDPQPAFIVYTGDNPPHDVWNETWSSQLESTRLVVDYLAAHLPPGLPIYPAVGNHESWPESEYLGTLPEYKVMTGLLAVYWQRWMNLHPANLATIAEGGYYSTTVMDGLMILSFNSDYGYAPNFYSFLNDVNPHYKQQWDWMTEQLQLAEQQGEKVLIIGHVPPGDADNTADYGRLYLNISRRFSETIIGGLFGHTHLDQFQLVQDEGGVYGVVLAAPSVTPYSHINPSFRLLSLDTTGSGQLRGYQQYHLNLTKANELAEQASEPQFELAYTTADDYGLKDLSPLSWAGLISRFKDSDSLLGSYHYNTHGQSVAAHTSCDAACRRSTLCAVSNIISSNYYSCLIQ